jgi:hypothetical protein
MKMEWISVKEKLPPISYLESDNEDDQYECYPVLVFSEEAPGIYCVAYLVQNQDEDNWNLGDLSWQLYIPGSGGDIIDRDLEVFSLWMTLPDLPKE